MVGNSSTIRQIGRSAYLPGAARPGRIVSGLRDGAGKRFMVTR